MSESALLFLVLAAVYLSECFFWVRRDALACLATWERNWRPAHPGTTAGNQHGGLLMSNPLPYFGAAILCQSPPVSIAPQGVYAYSAQALDPAGRPPQTGRFNRFEEIHSVASSGRDLLINRVLFARAASPGAARGVAQLLRELAALDPAKRERVIRAFLESSFDRDAISARVKEHRRRTRALRILCTAQFVLMFGVAPAVVWLYGLLSTWVWLLSGMGVLHLATLFGYWRAHRALYPGEKWDRRSHLAVMMLSPPAAIRARDLLARELLPGSHPLALVAALCAREAFLDLARRALRDARFPLPPVCPSDEPAPRAVEEWWRLKQRETLERFAQRAGASVEELSAPPARQDSAVMFFCPRCQTQYLRADSGCPDCGGLSLAPLPAPAVSLVAQGQ